MEVERNKELRCGDQREGMSDINEVEVVHPLWRGQNQSRKGYPFIVANTVVYALMYTPR
jgi:hypothetical protein